MCVSYLLCMELNSQGASQFHPHCKCVMAYQAAGIHQEYFQLPKPLYSKLHIAPIITKAVQSSFHRLPIKKMSKQLILGPNLISFSSAMLRAAVSATVFICFLFYHIQYLTLLQGIQLNLSFSPHLNTALGPGLTPCCTLADKQSSLLLLGNITLSLFLFCSVSSIGSFSWSSSWHITSCNSLIFKTTLKLTQLINYACLYHQKRSLWSDNIQNNLLQLRLQLSHNQFVKLCNSFNLWR